MNDVQVFFCKYIKPAWEEKSRIAYAEAGTHEHYDPDLGLPVRLSEHQRGTWAAWSPGSFRPCDRVLGVRSQQLLG